MAVAVVAGKDLCAENGLLAGKPMDDSVSLLPQGKTYEANVPDTLDLADRARMAISGLGGNIDPKLMTMYGLVNFCTVVGAGRLLRALLVWRELSGGKECDRWLDELCGGLRRILVVKGDYGYYPEKGRLGRSLRLSAIRLAQHG